MTISNKENTPDTLSNQDKTLSLYSFIRDLCKLRIKTVNNIEQYSWCYSISEIPNAEEYISFYYRDTVNGEGTAVNPTILSVKQPSAENCPQPGKYVVEWLNDGWNNHKVTASVKRQITKKVEIPGEPIVDSFGKEHPGEPIITEKIEHFEDNPLRVSAFNLWLEKRNHWVVIQNVRDFFFDLFQQHTELERNVETLEMVIATGVLQDRENIGICHPMLMKRVTTRFDAKTNTIFVEDTDIDSELYTVLFQEMNEVRLDKIPDLRKELKENGYHPLDRNETTKFLLRTVHEVSPDSYFSQELEIPKNWENKYRLYVQYNPMLILRKRDDGTLRAVEQIIDNIKNIGYVPKHLCEIVSGGEMEIPPEQPEATIEEQLASVGGESADILLSKEANREQLAIAQRIEQYNAVLVQGPPGTGKTHTIANLMGHFLAKGNSVLVTSYTKKALHVLKDQIAPDLQNLCVSVLDDSNVDMERSIDGITDYMSRYTSFELKREVEKLKQQREQIMDDMADTRRKMYAVIHKECETIVINGVSISPSKAAAYVNEHVDDLDIIPGKVKLRSAFPLSMAELAELYRSNAAISKDEERELCENLPEASELLSPQEYLQIVNDQKSIKHRILELQEKFGFASKMSVEANIVQIKADNFGMFKMNVSNPKGFAELEKCVLELNAIEDWMLPIIVDGKRGGEYRNRWEILMLQIQATCDCAEEYISRRFGRIVEIDSHYQREEVANDVFLLKEHLAQKGKVTKLDLLIHKEYSVPMNAIKINGHEIQNVDDCDAIIAETKLSDQRRMCQIYWNQLFTDGNVIPFENLDPKEPERVAKGLCAKIIYSLNWYQDGYSHINSVLGDCGIPCSQIQAAVATDTELGNIRNLIRSMKYYIPAYLEMYQLFNQVKANRKRWDSCSSALMLQNRKNSELCKLLYSAMNSGKPDVYMNAYDNLSSVREKTNLYKLRKGLLLKLSEAAPDWAELIDNRIEKYCGDKPPERVEEAWICKQYSEIINEILSTSYEKLQKENISFSKEYRRVTAQYASKSAWFNLLQRTEADIDMKQALQGWKITVKKIGKGTGKNAAKYRAQAQRLMAKCQTAVPGWIMPIGKAMESLNPAVNRFDVIIIDEASQADISALAIAYMGRKLIIVGDDRQVSPMAVGVDADKINAISQMYLANKIPNSHLYDAKTSLYDIAQTTFQPLMLREHFRCVPDIIGFSNGLSYDYKIKPLRDASSSIISPAVVNYRVADGLRTGKVNKAEAKTVVALLEACIEQPEYQNSSFGIISMLGDDQVEIIQKLMFEYINKQEMVQRRILCGNAANFQGDERDVVFLSLVDSGNLDGPLSLMGFGQDDAYRKRYNVATSRARDQLWIIDSLDPINDLKPDDIRKRLIDYSLNPQADAMIHHDIEDNSESPFEREVAEYLVNHSYHIEQQRRVGAYRLDIVAVCGEKKIALECDGERYHSGEQKIREDMERQTILERLGWKFIRIRGSEYYRNHEDTMERVIEELNAYGIYPESIDIDKKVQSSELLTRVKLRAQEIIAQMAEEERKQQLEN